MAYRRLLFDPQILVQLVDVQAKAAGRRINRALADHDLPPLDTAVKDIVELHLKIAMNEFLVEMARSGKTKEDLLQTKENMPVKL